MDVALLVDMGVVDMEVVAAVDVAVDVEVDVAVDVAVDLAVEVALDVEVDVDPDTVVISFLLDDILKSKNFSIKI